VDVIAFLGMDEGHNGVTQKPQGHESLFTVVETVIPIRVRDALEQFFGINEIEAMFLQVQTPFPFIPSDHRSIVYTDRICVKYEGLRDLTNKRPIISLYFGYGSLKTQP